MKTTSIYYEKVFPVAHYLNEKYGVEKTVEYGETIEDVFEEAKREVLHQFCINNPHLAEQYKPSIKQSHPVESLGVIQKDLPIQTDLIPELEQCESLMELESYWLLLHSPEEMVVYDTMKEKLTKQSA